MLTDLVSLIVPCYKAERHIANLIRQVESQTYRNWELILVGNGERQQKQFDVIKPLLAKNKKIKYISIPVANVSIARNKGIECAQGHWLIFVDVDDDFSKDYVASFARHAERTQNTDIINAGFDIVYDGIRTQHITAFAFDSSSLSRTEAFGNLIKSGHTLGLVWCKMFSMRFLRNNNLQFDTSLTLCEDLVFCFKAFLIAERFVLFEHCGYSYHRRTSDSALSRYHPCLIDSMRTVDGLLSQICRMAGQSEELIALSTLKKEYGWAIDEITGTFRLGSPHKFRTRLSLVRQWFSNDRFWKSYALQAKKSMPLQNRILYALSGCRNAYMFTIILSLMIFARDSLGSVGRTLQAHLATK